MGAGTIGYPLVSSLVSGGHEVLAIDTDPERSVPIVRKLGGVFLEGDATVPRTLRRAGANRANIFIATTGKDEDNLAACLLAKNVFNTARTIAVANSPENAALFEMAGVDVTVSATDLVLANIAGSLPAHPLIRLMPIRGRGLEVVGIKIPDGGLVVGKPLKEIQLPYGSFIGLIINSSGQADTPVPETVIEGEDQIIAVSPEDSTGALWDTLTELR